MMNYKETKIELKKMFVAFLKPLGFKAKSGSQGCEFRRDNIYSLQRVGYGVSNYNNVFYTGCYIRLSNYKIQNIKGEIFQEWGEYDTIAAGISNYFNDIHYRFQIEDSDDIQRWGEIVKQFYYEYAIPFFEQYNTVAAIDKLFNETPTEKVPYCDDLGWRIIIALIAAKLNLNPQYRKLRDYYESEVEEKFQGYFMYEKCMKVIDFLDNHTFDEIIKISEG